MTHSRQQWGHIDNSDFPQISGTQLPTYPQAQFLSVCGSSQAPGGLLDQSPQETP